MDLGVRRWLVVGAVVLSGAAVTAGGAMAQEPPGSSTSTTSVVEGAGTTVTSPGSSVPTTEDPGPPDLTVTLSYACPVTTGSGAAVPGLTVAIVNRGGAVEVDLVVDGVTAPQARGIEVPQSYLGIPQVISFALPEGEPGASVGVDVVESGTGRVLAGAGFDHRPRCEGSPVLQAPPATPTAARATFTG